MSVNGIVSHSHTSVMVVSNRRNLPDVQTLEKWTFCYEFWLRFVQVSNVNHFRRVVLVAVRLP